MGSPVTQPPASPERERHALFISAQQQERIERLRPYLEPILGTDGLYADIRDGSIFYTRWQPVRESEKARIIEEGVLPPKYILISPKDPRADIFAPNTGFTVWHTKQIIQAQKDGGPVEVAIGIMDNILEGQKKERRQAHVIRWRARELFDLFSGNFSDVSDTELTQLNQQTYNLLRNVNLDPEAIIEEHKRRAVKWLLKGSGGRDSLERRNKLITLAAISGAWRLAQVKHYGIGKIGAHYSEQRWALVVTREFCRDIHQEVADRIRPTAMPAHVISSFTQNDRLLGMCPPSRGFWAR